MSQMTCLSIQSNMTSQKCQICLYVLGTKYLTLLFDFKCFSFPKLLPYISKGFGEKAYQLYELNLLAFVHKKFKFWPPKCPNYENIEF